MPGSLHARDVSKSFAAVQVLDRVSLVVVAGRPHRHRRPERDRQVDAAPRARRARASRTRGTIVRAGAVGYLPQEPERGPGETRARATSRGARASAAAEREMDALAARLDGRARARAGAYADALDRFLALGGEDFDGAGRRGARRRRASAAPLDRELASLSGGEAARAALAAILLARFDVFLLDEPTNNLDFAGLDRLERFLDGLAAGVVLVSHDRAFLDRTVTRVVEIEAETRRVARVRGRLERVRGGARAVARRQHEAGLRRLRRRARPLRRRSLARAADAGGAAARAATAAPTAAATNALRGKVSAGEAATSSGSRRSRSRGQPWRLRLEFAPAPPSASWSQLSRRGRRARRFTLGPVDLELHCGRPARGRRTRTARGRRRCSRALLGDLPLAARYRGASGPAAVLGELDQARGALHRRAARRLHRRLGARPDRGADAAREVRARRRRHRAARRPALARRAHPRSTGAARGARRQLPRARRADEPPRPRGDRGARARAARLPRAASSSSRTTAASSSSST